ncbi:sugar phosphate isomerase/epimerase [Streptomyces hygroscopicus subsp. hygroscopicus]|uniref:Sugar phosphate isomerase n=1 Tax=Streptomyces hygroscopicus TaxID=1912 RepID=A0ABQ3U9P2_STRHY|nr:MULTISPECIES: sugar phosphate isomerase/epimerase [Streptomyces]MBW8093618.1 sugar phosphate isomerase/epimerase [Streptomyces hygroscopicus subsp. hygroscopicus]MCO8308873.1 sugar phosphate isomerase/epimerase [Streptomyces sp. RKCA744]GHJ32327.1 sugar phosphate isomerase [Streptomyces hygroscopicus]
MKSAHDHPELAETLRRRRFLGVAAGATAATVLGTATAAAAQTGTASPTGTASQTATEARTGRGGPLVPRGHLGIQLYTLRDQVQSLGFARVFQELARYGYDQVEFAGYTQGTGDITLKRLRRLMRDNGLRGIGSHVGYYSDDPKAYTFATNLTQVLDDAEELGLPHVGTASGPWRYGTTVDGWKRCAEEFNTYGAAARARGLKFYQHNHAEEFSFATDRPDVRLYDVLLAETDPELVHLEMDIYWAYVAQYRFGRKADGSPAPFEPLDYVLRAPHRYPLFHVKDGEHDETVPDGYQMVDVGDGDIDYRGFLTAVGRTHGGRRDHHWLVEHDQPADSLTTARRSARYLRSLRCGGRG